MSYASKSQVRSSSRLHELTRMATVGKFLFGAILCLDILSHALWAFHPRENLRDYASFLTSGKAYELGLNPYAIYRDELAPGAEVHRAEIGDWKVDSVNLNPPISVYGFRYLAEVDGRAGKYALSLGSLVLYGLIVGALLYAYPMHRRPFTGLVLLSLAGLWQVVHLGQIYVLLFGAMMAAWFFLRKGHFSLAGMAMGLVIAIKPPFAIVPVLLFLSGYRRCGSVALVFAGAISLMPLLLDGPLIYEQWVTASHEISPELMRGPGNSSLPGVASRIADPLIGVAGAAVLLAGAMWLSYRLRPDAITSFSFGIAVVLLVGPLTWAGYALFLLPVLLSRPWGGWEWLVAANLAFPIWLVLRTFAMEPGSLVLSSVYFWPFVIMLVLVLKDLVTPPMSGQRLKGVSLLRGDRGHRRRRDLKSHFSDGFLPHRVHCH